MQIFEITQPGSFKSQAGVFGKAVGQGIMQQLLPGMNTGSTTARAGDPQSQAAAISEPVVRRQAEELTKMWNGMVADEMKKARVSLPNQIPGAQKQALARNLMNMLNKTLLQNRFGNDFRVLPRWVDQKSQPESQKVVQQIERGIANILNWQRPADTVEKQQAQWYDLANAASQAVSLVTFRPNQAALTSRSSSNAPRTGTPKTPPKITSTPTGQYKLGDQTLDPRNPSDAAVIAAIQAQEK